MYKKNAILSGKQLNTNNILTGTYVMDSERVVFGKSVVSIKVGSNQFAIEEDSIEEKTKERKSYKEMSAKEFFKKNEYKDTEFVPLNFGGDVATEEDRKIIREKYSISKDGYLYNHKTDRIIMPYNHKDYFAIHFNSGMCNKKTKGFNTTMKSLLDINF